MRGGYILGRHIRLCIRQYQQVIFSAAQGKTTFEMLGRSLINDLCYFCGSDKRHNLDPWMVTNSQYDLTVTVHNIEHTVREAPLPLVE